MASREETLAAVLAIRGTRSLHGETPIPWPELEDKLKTDLTGGSEHLARVRCEELPPSQWLDQVAERGATRLGLVAEPAAHAGHPLPDHVLRAFAGGGGGGVLLCAVCPERLLLFRYRTRRVRYKEHRGKFASYEFADAGSGEGSFPEPDLAGQRSRLDAALRDIGEFARQIDQAHWADLFAEARATLDSGEATPWLESLFGSASLERDALGLLAASFKADVFGGMGSWNDIPSDDPRYVQLSNALSGELLPSFVAAVNSC